MKNQEINEFLIGYISERTDSNHLDISDHNICWTWYDDEGENCGTTNADALEIHFEPNGRTNAWVVFSDGLDLPIQSLNYGDIHGDNFANYLYDELTA